VVEQEGDRRHQAAEKQTLDAYLDSYARRI